MFSIFKTTRVRTLSRIVTPMAVAVAVGQLIASWLSLCGASPDSLCALALGFGFGVTMVSWFADRISICGAERSQNFFTSILALAVIGLSWCVPDLLNVTLLAGCESIGSKWPLSTLLTMLFPAAVVALVTTVAGLSFRNADPHRTAPWSDLALAGTAGIAMLLLPTWLQFPVAPLATLVTLITAFAMVTQLGSQSTAKALDKPSSDTVQSRVEPILQTVWKTVLPFAASGLLIVALTGILSRLIPGNLPVFVQSICIAAVLIFWVSRPLSIRLLNPSALTFAAILTLALLPVVFGPLAWLNLEMNAAQLPGWLVLCLRSLQYAVFATAAFVPSFCTSKTRTQSTSAQTPVLSFIAGLVAGLAVIMQSISPIIVLAAGIVVQALACIVDVFAIKRDSTATMRRLAFPSLSLLSGSLVLSGNIDTSSTSSFIFSERTAAAVQRGVARDLIAQSDASRLVTALPVAAGEVTVWRRTGNIYEFQRNGMLTGRFSTDTSVSPQPAEEILPAILALSNHAHPSRVLLLGDDTGVCLQVCTHFPVREIVAVRTDVQSTGLARKFTWSGQQLPPDQDERVQILHEPSVLAVRRRELRSFDVVIASGGNSPLDSSASEYSAEFYQAARRRMNTDGVFCQRFRQVSLGPAPLKATISTLMKTFANVGVVQTVPGEMLLLASDSDKGLIDPEILPRLQHDHVRREIATAGWDWAQVAILPLIDARDPIGIFSSETPERAMSISNCGLAMLLPYDAVRVADKQSELHNVFGPHQQQILAVVPAGEDREEVKRRMSALAQQLEILAGMPDQPWTYRKSLQMEMKQSPRPPRDLVESGKISKVAHPLDRLRKNYFLSLGAALSAASRGELNAELIRQLEPFTSNFEPLMTHFAHYEIIRLHELSKHPSPVEEFGHRLHIVFFTSPTDASVRPVISAVQQLVDQPSLIGDDSERYDILNSLLQKMIERWEARTAWEPRSAIRVQNDVDLSVSVANRALALMEELCDTISVEKTDFYSRRRFVNVALINPLREYRDQVLDHRMKSEAVAESNTENPHNVPLLIDSGSDLNTN